MCTGDGRARAALDDDDVLDRRRVFQRLVGHLLERHDLAAAVAAVRGDEQLALRVVDAIAQRFGAEAAEDDEWMAPMRAQASMAIASSGISGM